MNKNLSSKKFTTLVISLFTFFVILPSVFGGLVSAQKAPIKDLSTIEYLNETPAQNNKFRFLSKEFNSDQNGCAIVTNAGDIGITFNAIEQFTINKNADELLCNKAKGNVQGVQSYFTGSEEGGLLGTVTATSNNLLKQRPLSSRTFIEEKIYAITHPGEKVYAQDAESYYFPGTGFQLLRPIQSLWGWSVNVVYGVMIFIIIFVAFGIMLRGRIGGAANITLQSAIPNIAIAMVLIPLSYAISGVFIDLVTVGTNVAHEFLIGPGSPARVVYEERSGKGDADDRGLFPDDYRMNLWHVKDLQNFGGAIGEAADDAGNQLNDGSFTDFVTSVGGTILASGGVANIINALVGLLLLITSVRILWLLLQKFVVFLLLPVGAPFIFATIAIPGNGKNMIMKYIKMLGAASLFYIVTYTMLLMFVVLSSSAFIATIPQSGNTGYVPPLLGLEDLGVSNSADSSSDVSTPIMGFVLGLVAIALYLNIPGYLKSIDDAWGTKVTIPKFFTDAYSSAKDSVNLARQGINTTRQVGTGIYNAPSRAVTATNRALQSAGNIYDRARGIKPGERGSVAYNRAARINDRINEFERRRRQAVAEGRGMDAQVLQRRIANEQNALKGLETSTGAGGAKLEGLKEGELTAEITWNGKGGPIIISEGQLKDLNELATTPMAGAPKAFLAKGKLTLKAQNFFLSPSVMDQIEVYKAEAPLPRRGAGGDPNSPLTNSFTLGTRFIPAGRFMPRIGSWFNFPANNGVRIVFDPAPKTSANPDSTGSTWNIGFSLDIYDVRTFVSKLSSITAPIQTEKYKFVIADTSGPGLKGVFGNRPVESNEIDLMVLTDTSLVAQNVRVVV